MDPITMLTAFAPVVVDLGKSLINKFLGQADFKPATIEQYVTMKNIDLDFFKTMNAVGGDTSYPWVEAVVRLMRPTIGILVLLTWAYTVTLGVPSDSVNNFASAVGFYLFGERSLFYVKKK